MMYQTLQLSVQDRIATLTLNMPSKRNAMSAELTAEFSQAVEHIRRADDVHCLVITGTGSSFCAGGDLAMLERMLDQTPDQNRREMGDFYRVYLSILHLDIPVIAAINGHAIGAGMAFTLGCDIRLAAEEAKIGFTFLNLGLHPGMGSTYLLPKLIGSANASDLLLTGRLITAQEAHAMGMVSRVVPRERLMDEAMAAARSVAEKPVVSVRMAKRRLVLDRLSGLEEALDYEATAQVISYASPEMRSALASLKGR